VRFSFIRAEKAFYPLTVLCRVLEVSRSGYYAFERRGPSKREAADRQLAVEVREVHQKSRRTYGSPRIHRELRDRQRRVGRKRIARLMREEGIVGRRRRRFCRTTDSGHGLPVAENILARKFEVSRPDQAWVTDITYIPTMEGWPALRRRRTAQRSHQSPGRAGGPPRGRSRPGTGSREWSSSYCPFSRNRHHGVLLPAPRQLTRPTAAIT
jgi:hypothetical protein